MGVRAIYKCRQCGDEFESKGGSGRRFLEYRCVNCDTIKTVKSNRTISPDGYRLPTKEEIGVCEKCGGELRNDIRPMCPECKSRDVEIKTELARYD